MQQLKVLALYEKLSGSENFRLHPTVLLEDRFVATGNDVEKKEQTDKFTKRLRVLGHSMNQLHELRSQLVGTLKEFKVYYKLVSSNFGYTILAKQYSAFEKVLRAYNKFVKSQKNNPEIIELCKEFNELADLNVFDMMLEDLNHFVPEVENRIKQSAEKYPNFVPRSEVSAELEFEKIKSAYKKK